MAVFNTLGDWENNEAGEELCSFFKTDNDNKKLHKNKNEQRNKNIKQKSRIKKNKLIDKIKQNVNHITTNNYTEFHQKLINKSPDVTKKKSSKLANEFIKKKILISESYPDDKPLLKKFKSGDSNLEQKNNKKCANKSENGQCKQKQNTDVSEQHKSKKRKKKKNKNDLSIPEESIPKEKKIGVENSQLTKRKRQLEKLKAVVLQKKELLSSVKPKEKTVLSLRQKMLIKLKAARFRFLNEQIYTTTSKDAARIFKMDPESFQAYHEGYKQQVKQWPLNPLDVIIKSVNKMPKTHVIADFGCGEARLARAVSQTVHSFDFVAVNDTITACDMAHVPLGDSTVDVALFCLSLMGTNLRDYLLEANRVLKEGGILKIAEVESRFVDINGFLKDCEHFGFKKVWMDLSHNLFYFIDFRKRTSIKGKQKLPQVSLLPCLYKKR